MKDGALIKFKDAGTELGAAVPRWANRIRSLSASLITTADVMDRMSSSACYSFYPPCHPATILREQYPCLPRQPMVTALDGLP